MGAVSKRMGKKKEEDVSLIFLRIENSKKVWNSKATGSERGTLKKTSGGSPTYTKT